VLHFYFASIISVLPKPNLYEGKDLNPRNRIRIDTSDLWIRIREAQKHPDPDSQHGFIRFQILDRDVISGLLDICSRVSQFGKRRPERRTLARQSSRYTVWPDSVSFKN
jgi:hypothetical protein